MRKMRCRYGEIYYLIYKTKNLTAILKVAFPFKIIILLFALNELFLM